jgi:uncharacterized protein (TIGR02117 family)
MTAGAFTFSLRRAVRLAAAIAAAILGLLLLYVLAAVPGALLRPAAADTGAEELYPVYLAWSEIHTDVILPTRGLSVDWSTVLSDADTPLGPIEGGYAAFGWGSDSFYRNVPSLADMSVPLIARAMFFDTTVVHVAPVANPTLIPPEHRRTMMVTASGLRALEQHILGSFVLSSGGKADAIPVETYGYGDAFYLGQGRYQPLRTCNQWTSEGLRLAGQPVGLWTPFSQSIVWVLGTDAEQVAQG